MAVYKKSAETRQKIIDATIAYILNNDYASFNLKELSKQMDIPRSLIYYYFANSNAIMGDLYRMRYLDIEEAAKKVIRGDEDPLVRLILIYVLFRRYEVCHPLFNEFILTFPTYATLEPAELSRSVEEYYHDSIEAFRHYNISMDGEALQAHILSIDALSRAIYRSTANGSIELGDKEITTLLSERTIMPTFHLTKAQIAAIVEEAHRLANQITSVESTFQYKDYPFFDEKYS